jgi:hypothetical protein
MQLLCTLVSSSTPVKLHCADPRDQRLLRPAPSLLQRQIQVVAQPEPLQQEGAEAALDRIGTLLATVNRVRKLPPGLKPYLEKASYIRPHLQLLLQLVVGTRNSRNHTRPARWKRTANESCMLTQHSCQIPSPLLQCLQLQVAASIRAATSLTQSPMKLRPKMSKSGRARPS